eukprot:8029001-Alexandrium_andersonii.AAC.1
MPQDTPHRALAWALGALVRRKLRHHLICFWAEGGKEARTSASSSVRRRSSGKRRARGPEALEARPCLDAAPAKADQEDSEEQ